MSTSALSQGIAQLESNLGASLFERERRRRVPTEIGAVVVEHARSVLARTDELADWIRDRHAGRAGRLRVGMVDVAALEYFPDAIEAFRVQRPEVELHLVVGPSVALLDRLLVGELDLAVCVAPPEEIADIDTVELRKEPLVLRAPSRVIESNPATWGPWVGFPEGSHTRQMTETALRALGADYEVIAESHQPEVLAQLVKLGVGWAVLPGSADERVVATRTLVSATRVGAAEHSAREVFVSLLGSSP